MRVTFSTFVTPARDSETWIAGSDACTSVTWGRRVGSIAPGAYRGRSARGDDQPALYRSTRCFLRRLRVQQHMSRAHGKEGVDGSSPSEGFGSRATALFLVSEGSGDQFWVREPVV